jgi:hypothetical protein
MEKPRNLHQGDFVQVERTDGYITSGKFVSMNADFITVRGTVGDDIGRHIHVPLNNVVVITSTKPPYDS